MAITKSGIETPTDPPSKKLEAPVKSYPGSSKMSTGGKNGTVCGPAEGAYQGKGRK